MSNISGVNGGAPTAPSQSNQPKKTADNQDADDFSSQMEKKEDTGKKQNKSNKGEKSEKSPQELMRSMKESMAGAEGKAEQLHTMKAETAVIQKTNAADAVDKINKIVDRIMVAEAGATKEVKVSFNQDFLAGTDVTIRKEAGKISVEFNTTSTESFNFLSKGEQTLANQLQNKLGDNVSVDINMQGSEMDQQQDGRSRNEFLGEDDQDEAQH